MLKKLNVDLNTAYGISLGFIAKTKISNKKIYYFIVVTIILYNCFVKIVEINNSFIYQS